MTLGSGLMYIVSRIANILTQWFYGGIMEGKFGKYVEEKRKEKGITLRGLASQLDIAPAYMSDIEKGHRYPPDKDKLVLLSSILELNDDETNELFDLAAGEKDNAVSPDLPEYIMGTEKARVALRLARDSGAGDATWQKVIDMLEAEQAAKKA